MVDWSMRSGGNRRFGSVVRPLAAGIVLAAIGACTGDDAAGTDNEPLTTPSATLVAAPETTSRTPTTAPPDTEPTSLETLAPPPSTTRGEIATAPPTSTTPTAPVDPTCPRTVGLLPEPDEPIQVILDTDFAADVDDAGALAVLHALADAGEVEILAVMVSDGGEAPSHRAVDAINTYYGRPDIPIGVVAGVAPEFGSAYVDALAADFPNDIGEPPAAVDLYREILASRPDDSVTIVSIGYLTNLDALLSSPPDALTDRPGRQLVDDKVRRWVAMGGAYPASDVHPFGAEFNFVEDATATANAITGWPTGAIFSGWEVGDVILTGAALQDRTPPENPVREAYRLFNGGQNRQSWDHTAVLVAVRGTAGVFEACAGRNLAGAGGSNSWELGGDGPHGFLRLVAPPADVASILDDLMAAPPVAS